MKFSQTKNWTPHRWSDLYQADQSSFNLSDLFFQKTSLSAFLFPFSLLLILCWVGFPLESEECVQLLSNRAAVFPRMKFVGQIPPSSGVPQQDTGMQASMAILALTLPLPLTQVFVHQSQRLPWNRKLWTSQGVVSKHVFSFTPLLGEDDPML